MEELKRCQGLTFDTISMRKLVEDRDTIHELTGKIQELQNGINCMNDSRDCKDAESVRSGLSHVPSQPAFFPLFRDLGGMLRSVGSLLQHLIRKSPIRGFPMCQKILIFDKFPTSATFACWKIRFKTEVCTCSQFSTEAMLWIKEVELVESVDDLKSSCSVRGFQIPNFESTRCEDRFSTEQNHK